MAKSPFTFDLKDFKGYSINFDDFRITDLKYKIGDIIQSIDSLNFYAKILDINESNKVKLSWRWLNEPPNEETNFNNGTILGIPPYNEHGYIDINKLNVRLFKQVPKLPPKKDCNSLEVQERLIAHALDEPKGCFCSMSQLMREGCNCGAMKNV